MKHRFFLGLAAAALLLSLCGCTKEVAPSLPPVSPAASLPAEPLPTQSPSAPPSESPAAPTITQPPTEPAKPSAQVTPGVTLTLESLRRQATGYSCAVAYVGYTESHDLENLWDGEIPAGCAEEYSFIKDIPVERRVQLPGGDVYCIVPVDSHSQLTVCPVEYDEDGLEVTGGPVYIGGGEPILLVCNISDILPNSLVRLHADSIDLEFSPFISLKDGSLATTAPDGEIYDFS